MGSTYRITRHAIDRYLERVDGTVTRARALEILTDLAARSKARPTPRHWMRHTARVAGTRYLYCAARHDVCLVAAGNVVVTVHSRLMCRRWKSLDLHMRTTMRHAA